MNLIDLITRKDRALKEISRGVCISAQVRENLKMRTVELAVGSRIVIDDAQEFDLLKCYPPSLGWKWSGESSLVRHLFRRSQSAPLLQILLVNEEAKIRETLFSTRIDDAQYWHDIVLKWPSSVATLKKFSLVLSSECPEGSQATSGAVIVGIAPAFNSRDLVPKLIKGVGLEIGPGLNPQIRPSKDVQVQYIEAIEPKEWVGLYKKTRKPATEETEELWNQYVVSNASVLEGVEDNSLDFIFSNHVFEHLMNPIGVLESWSRKLCSSGLIYNVVPDANSCFDLRQPLSHAREWWEEYEHKTWQPGLSKYEKWCKYTAPYNTPEDLIKRQYSIHTHYYTPRSATQLAEIMVTRGVLSSYFIRGAWNHKDFAMMFFKENSECSKPLS
jgi:SAM-dependent methyltransferase